MTTRRGLPREPTFTFTEATKVDRPAHDCAKYGHIWKKSETQWPGEDCTRLTQTCTHCGAVQGRSIK